MEELTLEEIELIETGLQAWRTDCYIENSSPWPEVDMLEEKLERMKRLLTQRPAEGACLCKLNDAGYIIVGNLDCPKHYRR